jgi:hypothetical protein
MTKSAKKSGRQALADDHHINISFGTDFLLGY